jgi:hypothetical protein
VNPYQAKSGDTIIEVESHSQRSEDSYVTKSDDL